MALDVAQAAVMGKIMRDPSYMNDLWKNDRSGRCIEEGRQWDDFNDTYLVDNKYTSVLIAIMGQAGSRWVSYGGKIQGKEGL